MTNVPPPAAKRVPKELVLHGDVRVDNYHWIRNREDPDVLEYAQKENEYTDRATEHTALLRERLNAEMESRIPEEDTSVPCKVDDYYYYERTVRGKQYPIHCRRRGSMDAEEEVYLDENESAEGHDYFSVRGIVTSPSHGRCAYMADTNGSERYRLFVKNLSSGELVDSQLSDVWDIVWGEEEDCIYYIVLDEVHRPYKVFKHVIGTNPEDDILIYHEKDPTFEYLRLSKTKSRKYIVVTAQNLTKSEVWLLKSDGSSGLWPMRARAEGVKYYVTHIGDRFFIVTNEDAPNCKLMAVDESAPDPDSWVEIIPNRESSAICVSDPIPWIEPFDGFLAMIEREGGLFKINVLDLNDMTSREIELPERFSMVAPIFGTDMSSSLLRFSCSSLIAPSSVCECDLRTGKLAILKKEEVPGYDRDRYELSRIVAHADDGTELPIFLVHRKGIRRDGANPIFLEAYGSYGDFEEAPPPFSSSRVSLQDRGVICAFAQIRGGGEMGGEWYRQGVMLTKKNTFTDFISCAEHLISEGYTSKERLVIRGRSAGGLLVGAAMTMRPDLFRAVVAEVAFVDVITTQTDPTIPLVLGEYEEWGDPKVPDHYAYQKSYSPYDNIVARDYPRALFTAGMNDPRVAYWEPIKMVAKLRELKTDNNLLLLVTNFGEGHGGGSGRYDSIRQEAFACAFVLDSVGISE